MGASFLLPIVQVSSWQEALERLQQDWNVDTSSVYAATMMEETDNLQGSGPHFDIDWLVQSTALVIGSEGNGLSPEICQALRAQNRRCS
jgi:tRNA G18 (ribose-2'-O)-methylase SpoU